MSEEPSPGRTPALRGGKEKVGRSKPPLESQLLINQPQRFSVRGLERQLVPTGRESKLHIFVTADQGSARATPEGATPGQGAGSSASHRPSGDSSLQQAPSLRKATASRPEEGQPWPARRDPEARASRGRAWGSGASPRRPQPAFPGRRCNGIPPSPQPDSTRGSSPLSALPSANFANFTRGPAGKSGRPRASLRAPAPARAPPRPPRTYRSGSPRRTCPPAPAAARAASPLGAGLGREAPRRRGNLTRWRLRRAARGGAREPESRGCARRAPCWIEAALRHGPGQGTYCVSRGGVDRALPTNGPATAHS